MAMGAVKGSRVGPVGLAFGITAGALGYILLAPRGRGPRLVLTGVPQAITRMTLQTLMTPIVMILILAPVVPAVSHQIIIRTTKTYQNISRSKLKRTLSFVHF